MDAKLNSESARLVILPGLLCDSRMFAAQLARFPDAMVVDGFYGGADRIAGMAQYALEQMPERTSLLGHSMGARVAFEVMRTAPHRVERLALVDTGIHPVRVGEREKRYALRDIGRRDGMEALVEQWLPPMLAPPQRAEPVLGKLLRSMCIDAGIEIYEAQIEALLNRPAVDEVLTQIGCSTHVIVGSEDQWSPPSQHETIAALIPGAQLRIVEGAGHMLPCEKPHEFNAILREWLRNPEFSS
jgi:pimeloyl-ACP methyl ester carboxylesterase